VNRRSALMTGAAVAAAAAGGGIAWWRARDAAEREAVAVWQSRFDTPAGGRLSLADLRGHPMLLNFWATWCPPCVKELPLLDRFYRDQRARGWQVIGLAVDSLAPVQEFLVRRPVSFPVGMAGAQGVSLSRELGNAEGSLPFTVVLNRTGAVVQRKLGAIKAEDLARWQSLVD
jgi:thiol-disulfide isomerase/thioredoxin